MPGGPPLFAANLQVADANTGPGLISSDYINAVDRQLQEEKALGITAVMVQVGFPALYAPFYGGPEGLLPYQDFYQQVALAVRNAGLKLIVENDVLLTGDISRGWGQTLTDFYASSTFTGPGLYRAGTDRELATQSRQLYDLVLRPGRTGSDLH